jgi:hypothetical protein
MNIELGDSDKDAKFIQMCKGAGIEHVKLHVNETPVGKCIMTLHELGMKAYMSVHRVDNRDIPDWEKLREKYEAVCFEIDPSNCLGIALPENVHMVTRVGARSNFGVKRSLLAAQLNLISQVIRKHGHKVIFPMRIDDIQGDVWSQVDFDIFDLETMLSPVVNKVVEETLINAVTGIIKKPYWFGKAGQLGGNILPAQQAKMLRRLKRFAKGAEYAFLWSESANERFHWSQDGKFIIDVLREAVKPLNMSKPMGGDPKVSRYKDQKRVKAASASK